MTTHKQLMNVRQIRITGFLYLLVIICAGFSQGYVRANIVVPDDAALTAANIIENEGLFRIGLVADLIAFTLDLVVSILFYQMLKPFGKTLAMTSSALRLLAHPAIGSLNLLNHYMAFYVLGSGGALATLEPQQLESLSLMFMHAHQYGYLIAGVFFGVHCFLLGLLLNRSGIIPQFFGYFMLLAGIGYLMESFGNFLFPGNEAWLAWVVGLSAALGEVELTLYFLIKGARDTYRMKLRPS
ncbi:DUF4386 domain-containing protein [Roseivirga sp.]|uniref:DUF4386 domain-containing protein n=1 Tax=Roseivirga sp. TaxID=1964215 RepID=UPI003B529ADE